MTFRGLLRQNMTTDNQNNCFIWFLIPKMYRKWCNLLFRLSLDFLLNFKMAAILNFDKANKQTIREKSDIDSKHIKITPLKFASIYFFISFRYIKKSNTHRLFSKCRTCKTAGFFKQK